MFYTPLTNHEFSYSAFWGQSFVAELTRISAHGEKKLKLRRASLIKAQSQSQLEPTAVGEGQGPDANATKNDVTNDVVDDRSSREDTAISGAISKADEATAA